LSLKHLPLEALECKGCPVIDDCAGGCRFRAPHPLAPDPVMCVFYTMNRDPDQKCSWSTYFKGVLSRNAFEYDRPLWWPI